MDVSHRPASESSLDTFTVRLAKPSLLLSLARGLAVKFAQQIRLFSDQKGTHP